MKDFLKQQAQEQLQTLWPKDETTLKTFKSIMSVGWQHTLQVDIPKDNVRMEMLAKDQQGSLTRTRLLLGRDGKGDRLPATLFTLANSRPKTTVVTAHSSGQKTFLDDKGWPTGVARRFLDRQSSVILVDVLRTGSHVSPEKPRTNQVNLFYTAYNRTDAQERVQDLLTTIAFARLQDNHASRVILYGGGQAGYWAMLAAPAADGLVADCGKTDFTSESALLAPEHFIPGILRIGGVPAILAHATPKPLFLFNHGKKFDAKPLQNLYQSLGQKKYVRVPDHDAKDAEIADWIVGIK